MPLLPDGHYTGCATHGCEATLCPASAGRRAKASTTAKEWVDRVMESWGLNGDVSPVPCPHCGKAPTLVVERVGRDLVAMRFQCRRWFGLRECFTGPEHLDDREWQDYGRRGAASAWNRYVARHRAL